MLAVASHGASPFTIEAPPVSSLLVNRINEARNCGSFLKANSLSTFPEERRPQRTPGVWCRSVARALWSPHWMKVKNRKYHIFKRVIGSCGVSYLSPHSRLYGTNPAAIIALFR
jgi:hypothetical protein